MKIICTKHEKEELMQTLECSEYCPTEECSKMSVSTCEECIRSWWEDYVEWEVTDD